MTPPPPGSQAKEQRLNGTRVLKACDACKARKVRCSGNPAPCARCIERKTACHFSRMQVPRRQKVATQLLIIDPPKPTVSDQQASNKSPSVDRWVLTQYKQSRLSESHVDRLLANARRNVDPKDKPFSFKGNGLFLTSVSYGLTFFSDSRLQSLSARLRNDKLHDLTHRISLVLQVRAKPTESVSTGSLNRKRENPTTLYDSERASKWIQIYFERIHPIYPFLDRDDFYALAARDQQVTPSTQEDSGNPSKTNRAWSVLYHCVLALGCQHDGGGSFEPATGLAWRLFSTALAQYPDLLMMPDSLTTVQALAAMAIYTSGISCLSIEHPVISEAARRVQRVVRTNLTGHQADLAYRTFWVLYSMEKVSSFYMGRTSLFVDHDISCPIPSVPDALFGDFDWFLTYARHARLLSRALTSLFSSGVIGDPPRCFLDSINQLNHELEAWRRSVPADTRPGQTFRAHKLHAMLQGDATRQVILWTHYLYSGFRIIMARATLQLAASIEGLVPAAQQAECKTLVMEESRSILELTKYIDAEPWAPLWTVAGVPVIALFTLFELVIFNPKHAETRGNLALLDVAGGYFSRLEYASNGSLPSSLVSEFAYIAREYVNNTHKPLDAGAGSSSSSAALGHVQNLTNQPNHQHQGQGHRRKPSASAAAMTLHSATVAPVGQHVASDTNQHQEQQQQPPAMLQDMNHNNNNNNAGMAPLISPFAPPPMTQDESTGMQVLPAGSMDHTSSSSPSGSVSMDGINFPMVDAGAFGGMPGSDFLLGTDVMDLFNYSVSGMDPFYLQAFDTQQP